MTHALAKPRVRQATEYASRAGLLALAARGLLAEVARRRAKQQGPQPCEGYSLRVSWAQLDPLHDEVLSDRLRVLGGGDGGPEAGHPLFADPTLALREAGGAGGMLVGGLAARELRDLLDMQAVLAAVYERQERERLSYVHSLLTLSVVRGRAAGRLQVLVLAATGEGGGECEGGPGIGPQWLVSLRSMLGELAAGRGPNAAMSESRLALLLRDAVTGRMPGNVLCVLDPLGQVGAGLLQHMPACVHLTRAPSVAVCQVRVSQQCLELALLMKQAGEVCRASHPRPPGDTSASVDEVRDGKRGHAVVISDHYVRATDPHILLQSPYRRAPPLLSPLTRPPVRGPSCG